MSNFNSLIQESTEQLSNLAEAQESVRVKNRLQILAALKDCNSVTEVIASGVAKTTSAVNSVVTAYVTGGIDALMESGARRSGNVGRQSQLTPEIVDALRTKVLAERMTVSEINAWLAEQGVNYKESTVLTSLRKAGLNLVAQSFYTIDLQEDVSDDDEVVAQEVEEVEQGAVQATLV